MKYFFSVIFIIVLTGFLSPESSFAQSDEYRGNWRLLEENKKEAYYYDTLTVEKSDSIITLWVMTSYKDYRYDADDESMTYSINKLVLQCPEEKYSMTDIKVFNDDDEGKKVSYTEIDRKIEPGSLFERILKRFCR